MSKKKRACLIYYHQLKYSVLLVREAKALQEAGYEVDVICIRLPGEKTFEVIDGLNVYKPQRRTHGEKHPLAFMVKLVFFLFTSMLLCSILHLRKGYRVVHVTSPPDFLIFAAALPRLMGVRTILDIHDITPELYERKFGVASGHPLIRVLRLLERLSCAFSHQVIIVCEPWRQRLIARGIPAHKLTVVMNVPDPGVFDPKRIEPMPEPYAPGRFVISYHGSYDELFGVETLIPAMKTVSREAPDSLLRMYGDGPLIGSLKETAREMGVERWVEVNGPVGFDELPPILARADIAVVPTRDGVFAGEALSMKSLEYIAMGVPVVISRTPGSSHYYDGSMVEFFGTDDPEDLARAVLRLYRNPARRAEMVENAKRFKARHNWEVYRRLYYEVAGVLADQGEETAVAGG